MRFHEEYRYKCIKHAAKMLRSKFKVHKTLGLVDEKLQEVDAKSTDMVHQVLSEYSANGGSFAMYVKRRIKLSAKEKTLDVDGIQNNEYLRGLFDKIGMADLLNNSGILETYRVLKSEYGHNDFSLLSDSEKKLLAFNQTSDLIKVSFDYLIRNALLTDNEIIYLIQKYLELKGKKFYFFDKARIDEYCLDEDKQDARDYVDFVSFVRISTYFLVFTNSVFKKVTSNPNALYIFTGVENSTGLLESIDVGDFISCTNRKEPVIIFKIVGRNNNLSIYSAVKRFTVASTYKRDWGEYDYYQL